MSSSLLEVLRSNLERSELSELAIGDELQNQPRSQKEKVLQQHYLKAFSNEIIGANSQFLEVLKDDNLLLSEELQKIRNESFDNFYKSIQSSVEYHTNFNSSAVGDVSLESVRETVVNQVKLDFSAEEVFGKYLDLHEHFTRFSNLLKKEGINQDYIQYIERFSSFFYLSDNLRGSSHYREYLEKLWEYLRNFYCQLNPLVDFSAIVANWDEEFSSSYMSGKLQLPNKASSGRLTNNTQKSSVDLTSFHDPKELEALGMDRLKEVLEAYEMKSGGSLQERVSRLWAIRGKSPEDIPLKFRAKKHTSTEEQTKQILRLEFRVATLCELMSDIIRATRRRVEQQQVRSVEEKEAELLEEEFGLASKPSDGGEDLEADEAPLYNPLNLPLGWDGKPIPYWLYKLHGLGVEYKCEVCGNQSYWGRKAFDRHFQEWKHSYGMRCLGVPNTKHFHDITNIDDVLTLYHKIKDQLRFEQYIAEFDEEFEDTQGNILNRRTYEDLARQGLL